MNFPLGLPLVAMGEHHAKTVTHPLPIVRKTWRLQPNASIVGHTLAINEPASLSPGGPVHRGEQLNEIEAAPPQWRLHGTAGVCIAVESSSLFRQQQSQVDDERGS